MCAVTFRNIDEICSQVAHVVILVCHAVYRQRRSHSYVLLGLCHVEVAVHNSCNGRSVGNDGKHLSQIKLRQVQCDILKGIGILIVGIYGYRLTVACLYQEPRRHSLVITQEDVVILINTEFLIPENCFVAQQVQPYSVIFHSGFCPEFHSQSVLVVIELDVKSSSMLQQLPVKQSVECVLRIVFVVLHLSVESHIGFGGLNEELHIIKLNAVHKQPVHRHAAVESLLW